MNIRRVSVQEVFSKTRKSTRLPMKQTVLSEKLECAECVWVLDLFSDYTLLLSRISPKGTKTFKGKFVGGGLDHSRIRGWELAGEVPWHIRNHFAKALNLRVCRLELANYSKDHRVFSSLTKLRGRKSGGL